ncbi:MAG: tRNA uridine-5-carboxymethylaminomethyl(34) synthesis GTPase MnmE [Pseudomonadota bacterium]
MAATIFALSTGFAVSAIAIVRISGPEAATALRAISRKPLPRARCAAVRKLISDDGNVLDEALTLYFPGPNSFTGDDLVELHCHGGRAVVRAVLDQLGDLPGLTPAEPGEFTQRAFENGRMDLTEVEALSDVLEAETAAQLSQAHENFSGRLREAAGHWRLLLMEALAFIEATIDWADEEVPEDVSEDVRSRIERLTGGMRATLEGAGFAERVRDGFEVALVGAPNVGKSSLLNTLAGREVALATAMEGTTRDIIELRLDVSGLPVTLLDMAGLRAGGDAVEVMGVDRARARASEADLRVFVEAPGIPFPEDWVLLHQGGDLLISNKCDERDGGYMAVSAVTGEGLDRLMVQICHELSSRRKGDGLIVNKRQRAEVEAALHAVEAAQASVVGLGDEVTAEYLRLALRSLERLAGRTDPEEVLGAVFSRFCLGK